MENKDTSWIADKGDGAYANPVLFADYSDPDVIRVGQWFYMTASSFNCTPGLPLLRSPDLVNWELIGHAIDNVPGDRYGECLPGCGVWAPAIRFHNNRFYIVFPTPDEGLYVTEAEDPAGEWSPPRLLLGGTGLIDPCPFWDDDGRAYVVHAFAFSRAGKKSILRLVPVSPDMKEILGEGKDIISAMGRIPTLEGPKFHKFEGKYYISAPAGGVAQGYQMIFRSDSVYGPYEEKIVLAQRGTPTNGPHQGSLVDDVDGNWWFLHFQEYQPWGRIVHLQPARWEDGWPVMGIEQNAEGVGKPVLTEKKPAGPPVEPFAPAASDDFTGKTLGLQWQWNANHRDDWYDLTGSSLILRGQTFTNEEFSLYPAVLAQKINSPEFTGEVTFSVKDFALGDEAGIAVTGLETSRLGLCCEEEGLVLSLMGQKEAYFHCPVQNGEMTLSVTMNSGGLCRFGYLEEGNVQYAGPAFHAKEGKWIGARFGLYCLKGGNGSAPLMEVNKVVINGREE